MSQGFERSAYTFDEELHTRDSGTPVTTTEAGTALTSGYYVGSVMKLLCIIDSVDATDGDEVYTIYVQGRDSDSDSWEKIGIIEIAGSGSPYAISETKHECTFQACRKQLRYYLSCAGTSPSIDCDLWFAPFGTGN